MPRPAVIVGLTTGRVDARWGPWTGQAMLVSAPYVAAVERASAAAIVLPAGRAVAERPELMLDRMDALLLTGGCDVDPRSYGRVAEPGTGPVDPMRDAFEIALVRAAVARDLPVLATCRGMQVMNVAYGGTLRQRLTGAAGSAHRHHPGQYTRHFVDLQPGSLAARAAGDDHPEVRSHHHQAVEQVGPKLQVTGRAPDGLVEALEDPSHAFALGIQWHPEDDDSSPVIAALVAAARTRRDGVAGG